MPVPMRSLSPVEALMAACGKEQCAETEGTICKDGFYSSNLVQDSGDLECMMHRVPILK